MKKGIGIEGKVKVVIADKLGIDEKRITPKEEISEKTYFAIPYLLKRLGAESTLKLLSA